MVEEVPEGPEHNCLSQEGWNDGRRVSPPRMLQFELLWLLQLRLCGLSLGQDYSWALGSIGTEVMTGEEIGVVFWIQGSSMGLVEHLKPPIMVSWLQWCRGLAEKPRGLNLS